MSAETTIDNGSPRHGACAARVRCLIRFPGHLMLAAVLAAAGFGYSSTARAATYYVAASGGSDSNDGTTSRPLATIQAAVSRVRPGDTVIIRRGRHRPFRVVGLDGTASARITFRGEPGAVIDIALGGGDGFRAIGIVGGSYLTFDSLELTDSTPRPSPALSPCADGRRRGHQGIKLDPDRSTGESVYPHHLVFSRLDLHHLYSHGILGTAHDSQFIENHVHDNGTLYRVVEGVRVATTEGYGTYLKGQRWLIRDNLIHDNLGQAVRTGNDPGASRLLSELLIDSVIENNIIYGNGADGPHPSGPTGCRVVHYGEGIVVWHGSGNIIRNNVVFANLGNGIRVNEDFAVSSTPNAIYNNTVVRNGGVGIHGTYAGSRTIVRNNISYDNSGGSGCSSGSATDICNVVSVSSNLVGVDPRFIDLAARDFRLRADSPARDSGEPISAVPVDFDGVPRPAGPRFDIGAFEYTAVAVPPPDGGMPPPPPGSCDGQFGHLPGYELCGETATECEVALETRGTCRSACAAAGSACITGYDETTSACARAAEVGCDTTYITQICVCSLEEAPTPDAGMPEPDAGAPSPDAGPGTSPDAGPTPDAGRPSATCWLVDHTLPDGGRGRATIECEHDVVGCSATPGRGGASGAVLFAALAGLMMVLRRRRP